MDTTAESGIADWNYIDAVEVVGAARLPPSAIPASTGRVWYVPFEDAFGTDAFTFAPSDCLGNPIETGEDATVMLNVLPRPDAPVAEGYAHTVDTGSRTELALRASDVDGMENMLIMRLHAIPERGYLYASEHGDAPLGPNVPIDLAEGARRVWYEAPSADALTQLGEALVFDRPDARILANETIVFSAIDVSGRPSANSTILIRIVQGDDARLATAQALGVSMLAILSCLGCLCIGFLLKRGGQRLTRLAESERAREREAMERVRDAARSMAEVGFNVVLQPFGVMRHAGRFVRFEDLRAKGEKGSRVFDTYADLCAFVATTPTAFISHQVCFCAAPACAPANVIPWHLLHPL